MSDEIVGAVEATLSLGQVCAVCAIEEEWIVRHVQEGLFAVSGTTVTEWRFSSTDLRRAGVG